MNRDEESYQVSHTYDHFLGSTLTSRAKNQKKKTWYQLLLMKASNRGQNVKIKELFGCFDEFFISMAETSFSDSAITTSYSTSYTLWGLSRTVTPPPGENFNISQL